MDILVCPAGVRSPLPLCYLVSEDWKPFQKTQEIGMCMSPTSRAFPKPSTTSWNWMFSSETLPPCEAISHSSRPSISCSGVGRPPTFRRWLVDWIKPSPPSAVGRELEHPRKMSSSEVLVIQLSPCQTILESCMPLIFPILDQRSLPCSPRPRAIPAEHYRSRNNAVIPRIRSIAIGFLHARKPGSTNSSTLAKDRVHL